MRHTTAYVTGHDVCHDVISRVNGIDVDWRQDEAVANLIHIFKTFISRASSRYSPTLPPANQLWVPVYTTQIIQELSYRSAIKKTERWRLAASAILCCLTFNKNVALWKEAGTSPSLSRSTLASSTRHTIVNNRYRASHFVYNNWRHRRRDDGRPVWLSAIVQLQPGYASFNWVSYYRASAHWRAILI